MPEFKVGMVHQVYESATVVIEADTKEDAEEMARAQVVSGSGVEWNYLEGVDDSLEVVSCDETATIYTDTDAIGALMPDGERLDTWDERLRTMGGVPIFPER